MPERIIEVPGRIDALYVTTAASVCKLLANNYVSATGQFPKPSLYGPVVKQVL